MADHRHLGEPPALAAPLVTETFGPADRDVLAARLRDQDRDTLVFPVDTPEQVLLDPDGLTIRGGYRYTGWALRQLCTLTVYGLGQALYDLAGLRRRTEEAGGVIYSLDDAITCLNVCLRRRFRLLDGIQLVCDDRLGLVEGLVGSRYRRLGNLDLLERAEDAALDSHHRPTFREAVLFGRTFLLRYLDPAPLAFEVPLRGDHVDRLTAGVYYLNSEVGDGSVRAGHLVARPDGTAAASWTRSGGKVKHQGDRFPARFSRLVARVNEWRPTVVEVESWVDSLVGTPLGFSGDRAAQDRRGRTAANRMKAKGFTLGLSLRIIADALARGADPEAAPPGDETRQGVWPGRNFYDFFCALARAARGMPIAARENVEYLAYQILVGRFYPVPPDRPQPRPDP